MSRTEETHKHDTMAHIYPHPPPASAVLTSGFTSGGGSAGVPALSPF